MNNFNETSSSVKILIDNDSALGLLPLVSFKGVYVYYDPSIQQMVLKNQNGSRHFYVAYTLRGNTSTLGNIPYTPVPQSGGAPLQISPGEIIYFTPSGQQEGGYNVSTFNSKVILDDLTITDGNGEYFQCNANNQKVGVDLGNTNRIMMACSTLTISPS